jgi:hypothetical protein
MHRENATALRPPGEEEGLAEVLPTLATSLLDVPPPQAAVKRVAVTRVAVDSAVATRPMPRRRG